MTGEIRQNGNVILSSEDGISISMISKNLCGKNFSDKEYRDYINHIALMEMGFEPGVIFHYRDGILCKNGTIPEF